MAAQALVIGTPWQGEDGKVFNAVLLLDGGEVRAVRYKYDLPNYSVFDEKRVFTAGPLPGPVDFRRCPDRPSGLRRHLERRGLRVPGGKQVRSCFWFPTGRPTGSIVRKNVCRSWCRGSLKQGCRLSTATRSAGRTSWFLTAVPSRFRQIEASHSRCRNSRRRFPSATGARDGETWICETGDVVKLPDLDEANWRACVMGLGDYVDKNGFPGVVLGLSGGIDSAICAAMAVDALGADRVHAIMLPYRYTSEESISDAAACASALGIRYDTVPIAEPVEGFRSALSGLFEGTEEDTTEENLQSRARGVILMAVSNKFGRMVMTTGNKSEMSVGYATLYGDMNGGYNPIKDLYKTQVYHLAGWRNANALPGMLGPAGEVIPSNIITKVPTAELRENQTDQDSLPPYDELDDILECLVEEEMSVSEIEKRGHDRALIHRIEHLLYIAEYKRRQAPPGVKITERNFGKDRRYPITNRFRDRT